MNAISMTIPDAVKASGLGRSKLYELIGEGKLKTAKIGQRRLVLADSLRELVDAHIEGREAA